MEKYAFPAEERAVLEKMPVPFAVYQFVDREVVTLVLSDGFCELFGYGDRAAACYDMDHDMYKGTHPEDVARITETALRFATEGGEYETVFRSTAGSGTEYHIIHALGRHVRPAPGVQLAYVWYTDEGPCPDDGAEGVGGALLNALRGKRYALENGHFDQLTGLPNARHFFELAKAGLRSLAEEGQDGVLLYLDFNGLKFFNHKFGYEEGDRLLRAFAKLLSAAFGSGNCGHFAQDHFCVWTREEGVTAKLEQLFRDCRTLNDGHSLPVRVGIYRSTADDISISIACDRAKIACDSLRDTYVSGYTYYSDEQKSELKRRRYILANLDRAIAEKWIQVCYQPIIRTANGKVCDEEALSRWIDPKRGQLSPAEFIPPLEDSGLIYKLDLYVVEQVLEKMRRMTEYGLHIVPHSVNLSRADFDACDIVEEIRKRVDAAGIDRSMLTIEITESIIGSDFERMKEQILRFQELGFPVWMDDFGSGYSSLDVLQSIKFNLIKFDMGFMRRLDEGEGGRIILTELTKMASALGVDTVCEGVETKEQVRFLQEIGCSKLQGFYYGKAISWDQLSAQYRAGFRIGYENPEEASYYSAIGRVNLYDLAAITSENENVYQGFFNTLPMGIIEVRGRTTRFVRSNQSYRDFVRRFLGYDLSYEGSEFVPYGDSFMNNVVKTCCEQGVRAVYDEVMPDGSVIHSFARRIGVNPVDGTVAVAVAVLSITHADAGTTYADIARALASDYYNIYYVDLETEDFIEYSSPVGGEELAMERHGERFFDSARRDTMTRIYREDRDAFLAMFTRENILRELDEQGVFTATYRLIDTGSPMYVSLKITRMLPDRNHIILGVSIVDAQMKEKAQLDALSRERALLARIMGLNEDYLSLYTIEPESGRYIEYSATSEYETLGFAKEGADFFLQGVIDGKKTVYAEDLPEYLRQFTRENVARELRENGVFKLRYRLVINGEPKQVSLRIARFRENGEEKLVAGVRAWQERN